MAAKTFADLRDLIYLELGEAGSDALAALPSGTGSNAIVISAVGNLKRLINEAKNKTFRVAALYRVSGFVNLASGAYPVIPLASLALANGQFITTATDVSFTPTAGAQVQLGWYSSEGFDNWFAKIPNLRAVGIPKYWAHTHETAHDIQIDQVPSVAGAITVYGYGAPVDLAADTDTIAGLMEDGYRAIVCYVCAKLCRKNTHDGRLASLMPLFEAECYELWAQLRSQVSANAQAAYLEPLVPKKAPGEMPPQPGEGQ